MSDQSSSDNTSSVAASSSRTVTSPSRPACVVRKQSYTHVFPAKSSSATLVPRKPQAKKRAQSPAVAAPMRAQDENTRLLFGGLQWLLDESVKPRETKNFRAIRESSEPLSEKAMTSFNARENVRSDKATEPAKTAAWIDFQRESPAAPPF